VLDILHVLIPVAVAFPLCFPTVKVIVKAIEDGDCELFAIGYFMCVAVFAIVGAVGLALSLSPLYGYTFFLGVAVCDAFTLVETLILIYRHSEKGKEKEVMQNNGMEQIER